MISVSKGMVDIEISYLQVCLNFSLQIHRPLRNSEVLRIEARCPVEIYGSQEKENLCPAPKEVTRFKRGDA